VVLEPDATVGVDDGAVEDAGMFGLELGTGGRDAPPMNSVEVMSFGGGLKTEAGMRTEDVREGTGESKEPVI